MHIKLMIKQPIQSKKFGFVFFGGCFGYLRPSGDSELVGSSEVASNLSFVYSTFPFKVDEDGEKHDFKAKRFFSLRFVFLIKVPIPFVLIHLFLQLVWRPVYYLDIIGYNSLGSVIYIR